VGRIRSKPSFEYFFLDQRFNEQYRADETQYKLLSNLSYICIFISLLGLLGLSAFTAAQRTKEIGIRKVHGAKHSAHHLYAVQRCYVPRIDCGYPHNTRIILHD
jgi:ABC-type antimicrobial peptide transport system permease subunit